jgi:WW domain-binding protein 2
MVHCIPQLIFVSAAKSSNVVFDSLSIPLPSILSTKFEQPFFGANYLTIEIAPSQGGGLTDGSKAEVRFKDKGLFEFTSALEKTRERAIYMRRQSADEDEGLRECTLWCVNGESD